MAAVAAAGGLIYCASMLEPWWWAAWLAPVPLLVVAFSSSARAARWMGMGAGLIGAAATAPYYSIVTGIGGAALIAALQAMAWGFVVGRTRDAVARTRHWAVVLIYPALWAAIDTLVTALSPHGSDGSMAYSQVRALPVLQIASWAGTPGVVFAVSLFASTLAVAWHFGRKIESPLLAYGLPGAALALALGLGAARIGAARLVAAPAAVPSITVGLAAIDRGPAMESPEPRGAEADAMWAQYGRAVASLAARGAQLVALPEKIAVVEPAAVGRLQRALGSLARRTETYLLAGVDVLTAPAPVAAGRRRQNAAWLFAPSGELLADYSKQHPVPGLEAAYQPGHTDVLRPVAGRQVGVVICKDLDYPELSRRYARAGASVVLQPAWDFDRDGWSRVGMAAMRAVESGFTVVHATRNGELAVIDRYGHVLGAAASASAPVVTLLVVGAPLGPGRPTPYARIGDVFGWCCVAASALAALAMLTTRQPRARAAASGATAAPDAGRG